VSGSSSTCCGSRHGLGLRCYYEKIYKIAAEVFRFQVLFIYEGCFSSLYLSAWWTYFARNNPPGRTRSRDGEPGAKLALIR